MRRLSVHEIESIAAAWEQTRTLSKEEQDTFEEYLHVPYHIMLPLGELWNPRIREYVWLWHFLDLIKPEPITDEHSFGTQSLEGCFGIDQLLSYAIRTFQ